MRQSEHYSRDWVEPHGGQPDPAYVAADLDEATEVAQADNAAGAREPINVALSASAAAGGTRADAPAPPTRKASRQMLQLLRSLKPTHAGDRNLYRRPDAFDRL